MVLQPSPWQSPPLICRLSAGEVQVWRVFLDQSSSKLGEFTQILSPEEQQRAARFHFELDRQRFQVARGVLRALLGAYLEIPPQQVRFEYNSYGKPYLLATDLQFNLSHSQEVAVYGFARGRQLGIDVECLRPVPQLLRIAERHFSLQEHATLQNLTPDQQISRFFEYWTCKEAYLKALGTGLSHPMPRIEIAWNATQPTIANFDPETRGKGWQIHLLQPAPAAIAALVVQGQDWSLTCWDYP